MFRRSQQLLIRETLSAVATRTPCRVTIRSLSLITSRVHGSPSSSRANASRFPKSSAALLQSRRTVFINTETTPNPHSMKFLPGQEVLPEEYGTGMYFQRGDHREVDRSPLAKAILSITGIKSIFLGKDFITVTKNTDEAWYVCTRGHTHTHNLLDISCSVI